eukprot:gene46855-57369_t
MSKSVTSTPNKARRNTLAQAALLAAVCALPFGAAAQKA